MSPRWVCACSLRSLQADRVVYRLIAREFEASRTTAVLAAACMSVSAYLAGVGHLLSTSTFDLLAWTILSWLLVRALRDGGPTWLLVGVTAGIALQNKMLVAFFLLAVFIGVLTAGPRSALRTAWVPAGVLAAVVVWSPYLIWQAGHGWPQLELSTAIAAGSSGTSESRWLFLPFQLVLVSIWLRRYGSPVSGGSRTIPLCEPTGHSPLRTRCSRSSSW